MELLRGRFRSQQICVSAHSTFIYAAFLAVAQRTNFTKMTPIGTPELVFLLDWDVAAARWWDEGGSSLSCDGRASTRFVVQNTAMSDHRESPAGSTGTIF